jgi:hypothetical protein
MISKEIQFFLKKVLLLCLVVTGLSVVLFDTILKGLYLTVFPLELAIVVLVTIVGHLRLMKSIEFNMRKFSTIYLSTMSLKLLVYFLFILTNLLVDRSNAINFVVSFLILYIIFTIFEVIEISNFLKKYPKSSN